MIKGSCLCGNITYTTNSPLGDGEICHCVQCRKSTGYALASTSVPLKSVSIKGDEFLSWYHSSEKARRGFCSNCGSTLFFDPIDKNKHDWFSIALGSIDGDTGCTIKLHIFTAEKGDYYEILDGARQNEY
ncbi:GFA family protein [Parashewanella curva]|uniref:GFA family protein n=1 Tax=Parashewanella curva TaxID=2338552 RepID=A0A3L8PT08_9GAMM|nr:GFA family protein [Parashewanella curva]RLV58531.1 GFA family protein [Parashewanella curva]